MGVDWVEAVVAWIAAAVDDRKVTDCPGHSVKLETVAVAERSTGTIRVVEMKVVVGVD